MSRLRQGYGVLLPVMAASFVVAVLAFAHAASVRQARARVYRAIAGRHAQDLAENLADEGPRLAQLAMNEMGSAVLDQRAASDALPKNLRHLGLGQRLRVQIPASEITEVINNVPVRVVELRAQATFLELDGVEGMEYSESACKDFASWRERWPKERG